MVALVAAVVAVAAVPGLRAAEVGRGRRGVSPHLQALQHSKHCGVASFSPCSRPAAAMDAKSAKETVANDAKNAKDTGSSKDAAVETPKDSKDATADAVDAGSDTKSAKGAENSMDATEDVEDSASEFEQSEESKAAARAWLERARGSARRLGALDLAMPGGPSWHRSRAALRELK